MTQDDRMETITDPAAIRASDEPDPFRRNPVAQTGPDDPWRFTRFVADDHECVIVRDEYDEPAPFGSCSTHRRALSSPVALGCTTSARVGAAVALHLDAIEAAAPADDGWWSVPVLALVAEVRRLTEESEARRVREMDAVDLAMSERARAEAAEADVVTLRARLAAVEALADQWADRKRSDGMSGNAWIGLTLSGVAADLRAALATTGEGQHVAREVFTADGIPFVSCSCTNAKSPTSSRWLTDWLIRYDPDDGEPYGEVCDCEIGDDHYATGEGE